MEECLAAALDVGLSNATVSHLLHEAGRRAGEILAKVDHSPLGPVVLARDELFTGRNPNLLLVEPRSLVTPHLRWAQVSLGCMPPKTAMPRPFDKLRAMGWPDTRSHALDHHHIRLCIFVPEGTRRGVFG